MNEPNPVPYVSGVTRVSQWADSIVNLLLEHQRNGVIQDPWHVTSDNATGDLLGLRGNEGGIDDDDLIEDAWPSYQNALLLLQDPELVRRWLGVMEEHIALASDIPGEYWVWVLKALEKNGQDIEDEFECNLITGVFRFLACSYHI